MLTVNLRPYQPRKAKIDPRISEDVREARRSANRDTTVIVEGVREYHIHFSDYLFLVNPSSEGLLKAKLGTIITASTYRFKIFVKGIYVEEWSWEPTLEYGVDINKAALDRDRKSTLTKGEVIRTLAEIWNDLIERDQGNALELYLRLMLASKDHLETLGADKQMSLSTVRKLFSKLKEQHPNAFFYCMDEPRVAEVRSLQ